MGGHCGFRGRNQHQHHRRRREGYRGYGALEGKKISEGACSSCFSRLTDTETTVVLK